MKYFSTFSGIGGFELGIGQEHECVGYSEIDKYAIQIYQSHFPTHKNYGDITQIDTKDLPEFDCLVGGFPCQSFSIAGKRGGFSDTRGTMFFELARILKEKQPRLCVFENVKGLLSHDQGNTFKTIIATLDELGYDCQWQLLNSKNHGVPQNRERVFIIGHLRGSSRPQVFPFGHHSKTLDELSGQHSNTLTTRYYGGQANGTYITEGKLDAQKIKQLNNPKHSNDRVYAPEGISLTLNTMQGGRRQPFIQQRARGKNAGGSHDIAPTLTGSSYQDNNHVGGVRRLTPIECERLQGFPDGWTGGVSDSQRYKTLGNAVTVNVVNDIFQEIFKDV